MVTFGIGEAIAVAQLVVQIVELGQKCADSMERWQAFGHDANQIYLKFSHENRKLKSLQHLLTDKDKLGLDQPMFELMDPQQQRDLRSILLSVLQLLHGFQDIANRLNLNQSATDLQPNNAALLSSALHMQALEEALPEMRRRDRWLQNTTSLTDKWRWTFGGKTDAEKLVSGIRQWLTIITEEIDLHFLTLAGPKRVSPSASTATSTSNTQGCSQKDPRTATLSYWNQLETDPDLVMLNLAKSMRIRKFVVQLQAQGESSELPFPSHLLLKDTDIRVGQGVQSNRYIATMTKGSNIMEGLVEFRTYREGASDPVRRSMESLCMILTESTEESFRLPKPEGIFHQEGSEKRVGLFFPLSAIEARSWESVWTLQRVLAPATEGNAKPAIFTAPPLEDRFKLALSLATALSKLHSVGWYYQGLQSKNICLVTRDAQVSFDRPWLFGFTKSRAVDDKLSYGDGDVAGNPYRHPDRWEPKPSKRHHALHDLYSLGVVLLEIGLWTPLPRLLSRTKSPDGFDLGSWTSHGVQGQLQKVGESFSYPDNGNGISADCRSTSRRDAEDNLQASSWQSWPAENRLFFAAGALTELCSGLSITLAVSNSRE